VAAPVRGGKGVFFFVFLFTLYCHFKNLDGRGRGGGEGWAGGWRDEGGLGGLKEGVSGILFVPTRAGTTQQRHKPTTTRTTSFPSHFPFSFFLPFDPQGGDM